MARKLFLPKINTKPTKAYLAQEITPDEKLYFPSLTCIDCYYLQRFTK
jgi:hypothetical protein